MLRAGRQGADEVAKPPLVPRSPRAEEIMRRYSVDMQIQQGEIRTILQFCRFLVQLR